MFFTRPLLALALFFTSTATFLPFVLGGGEPSPPLRRAAQTLAPDVEEKEPLVVPRPGDGGFTIHDLLIAYGERSNQVIVFASGARDLASSTKLSIDRGFLVPADGLHSVVEALLVQHDFLLSIQREAEPRILAVHSLRDRNVVQRPHKFASFVPESDLERFLDHPALLIETVVVVEHLEAPQLANIIRGRATGSCDLVAATPHQVLLTGYGRDVARTAGILRRMDDAASEMQERAAKGTKGK